MKHPWNITNLQPSPLCSWAYGDKEQIAAWVRNAFDHLYGDDQDFEGQGCCLYWTFVGCHVLRRAGYRAQLQAGTMLWPCAKETGNNPTHFGYEWTPDDPSSVLALCEGRMPEIHTWIGLADEGEIVDFSTYNFRKLATERYGLTWDEPSPPEYLWERAENLMPRRIMYRPIASAIRYIYERFEKEERPNAHGFIQSAVEEMQEATGRHQKNLVL